MPFLHKVRRAASRHRLFCLLIVAELVFLLAHFALAMRVQAPLTFSGSELTALSADALVTDGAVTMQDSENYGPFAETPLLSLKKGSYTASVSYDSSLEGAKIFQDNDYVTMNDQVLEASDHFASFTLWAKGDTATSFKFSYNGGTRTIYQFTITPTHAYARVSSLEWLLFFALLDLILLVRMGALPAISRSSYPARLIWAGLAGLVVLQSLPMFAGFLFSGHDLTFHLSRIEGIASGLAAHEFPVKIYPSLLNGQGYANGVFYGDLLLYVPAILRLVGFSLQASYQIFVVLLNLATVLIAYWCFGKIANDHVIGFLGAALYSLNLYRLTNLYVRAAVGEYSAMTFLPLILYALWAAFTLPTDDPGYKKLWIPGVIGYSGLIVTHILTCGMAAIFTILACLVCIRRVLRKETFLVLAKIVIYTTLCCLWFLVPFADYMLTDTFRVQSESFSIWHTLVQSAEPLQLFDLFAKASGATAVLSDGIGSDMSFTVGGALLLACLIVPALCILHFTLTAKEKGSFVFLALGCLSMWMTTACFPWYSLSRILPPLGSFVQTMQFNWRFQAMTGVLLAGAAVLGLLALRRCNKTAFWAVSCVLCCTAALTSTLFFHDVFQTKDTCFYREMSDMEQETDHTAFARAKVQISMGEYLPAESDPEAVWFETSPRYNADALTVSDYQKAGLQVDLLVENHTAEEQALILPLTAYKGYQAQANGSPLSVSRAANGQVQISLPADFSGHVTVRFQEPLAWRIAELISFVFLLAFVLCSLFQKRRENSTHPSEVFVS